MNNITALLSLLGQNGLMPAAVPSAVFVLMILILSNPSKLLISIQQLDIADPLIIIGTIITVPILILSFTLTALNNFILKILQGYIIFYPVKFLYNKSRNLHIRQATQLKNQREALKSKIEEIFRNGDQGMQLEQLRDQYYQVVSEYNLRYPENMEDILPTQFGNIIKAAETYSGERYGFDGVHFWPRFISVIPAEYKSSINDTRNELSFHVNMAILSVLFFVFCIFAVNQTMWISELGFDDPTKFTQFLEDAFQYLLAAMLGLISASFFYRASILSVVDFGLMMRSSSDLFRLDLLKRLGLERPRDSIKEFETWQSLNELIVLGSHSLTFKKLDYRKEE